jgi:hypothetical protein
MRYVVKGKKTRNILYVHLIAMVVLIFNKSKEKYFC